MREPDTPMPPPGRLTASRLSLAAKCPGAFALPHVETENEASAKGTLVHAYIERVLATGEEDVSGIRDPETRKLCQRLDARELYWIAKASYDADKDLVGPRSGESGGPQSGGPLATDLDALDEVFTEVPFALDPETGEARPLFSDGHRDYSGAPEGWVCGTADVVAVAKGGAKGLSGLSESPNGGDGGAMAEEGVVITDWKTGMIPVDHPEANLQLRFLALAATRAYGVQKATVQIAYIDNEGEIRVSAFEFGLRDLDEIAEQLRDIASRVEEARTESLALKVGSHCRYCPALRFCPAQASAARSLLDDSGEDSGEELTPQEAALIWDRLQAVKHAIKMSEEVLQAYVEQEDGIELPGGGQLKLVTSKRDRILPEVTMPLLRHLYGDDADKAVSITKKGLSAVAGERAKALLAEIGQRDGIRTSYSERLQEVGRRS